MRSCKVSILLLFLVMKLLCSIDQGAMSAVQLAPVVPAIGASNGSVVHFVSGRPVEERAARARSVLRTPPGKRRNSVGKSPD